MAVTCFPIVMKKEGWDFKETLQHLATRAGVRLETQKPANKERKAHEDRLADLLAAAAAYFHQLLLYAPQGEVARKYVADRALTEQTLAHFQIGFALEAWDQCRTHFNAQGYDDNELLEVGLLTENPDKGTRYDRFRNRLMIPIQDGNSAVSWALAREHWKKMVFPNTSTRPNLPYSTKAVCFLAWMEPNVPSVKRGKPLSSKVTWM